MAQYEFRVIPAPTKGPKVPGLKTNEARYAHAVEELMNDLAQDGWMYHRADTLPMEVREGLRGTKTVFQSLLVFRREIPSEDVEIVAEPEVTTITPQPLGATMKADPEPAPEPKEEKPLKAERAKTTITNVRVSPKLSNAKVTVQEGQKIREFEPDEPTLDKEDAPNDVLLSRAQRLFASPKKKD
ncbi:hypothetical protein [Donghicola eburneus]|uniref:DUF4177 domain-containing protein n=1 Tax=Donghicola eburneus TaxID=393278 RepID=A0A1M4N3G6_9RHOB|nr:hypothetical protein [Donghicola eburneus]SCM68544.1 hypothetical protein KARMA_2767 [Donghicola eburneus]SFQ26865.1 hypothetical protein SAMN05421764_102368 [Donghicola eburneus]